MKTCMTGLFFICLTVSLSAQGGYSFRSETLPVYKKDYGPVPLNYTANLPDVSNMGMGKIQTATRGRSIGMLSNPAFLAQKDSRIDVFSLQAVMPPETWDAAWFLEEHMNEFLEAASLNQIMDAAETFFTPGLSVAARWDAIREVQEGLAFTVNLMNEVTGPSDAPKKHGFAVLPGFSAQFGNWGVSVYGYGQASFMVRQSPTLEALAGVYFPEQPENLLQVTKPVLQVLGILGTSLTGDSRTFSETVFPVALYLSNMDVVGNIGYGRPVWKRIHAGANLKIINRRFSINRIPVVDYDAIIENAFSDLSKSVTGVTLDLGLHSELPFGMEAGVYLMNVIPVKKLEDGISMEFINHQMAYDLQDGQKQTNENGDTLLVRYTQPVEVMLPFELKLPFIMNAGIQYDITSQWSAGVEWLDILENYSIYESTAGRLRIGYQYRQPLWKDKLTLTGRIGMGDEHLCGGLGLGIVQTIFIDSAYAWDPMVKSYSFYAQIRAVL